jgi:hypothetical protein
LGSTPPPSTVLPPLLPGLLIGFVQVTPKLPLPPSPLPPELLPLLEPELLPLLDPELLPLLDPELLPLPLPEPELLVGLEGPESEEHPSVRAKTSIDDATVPRSRYRFIWIPFWESHQQRPCSAPEPTNRAHVTRV